MAVKISQAQPSNRKTHSSRSDNIPCNSYRAPTQAPLEKDETHAPSIASRRRRPAPPALNILSLQLIQPVKIPSTIPRVLYTKRPTTKDSMRLLGDFSTPSAKVEVASVMPVSMKWLDQLEMSLEKPAKDSQSSLHCSELYPSNSISRLDRVLGLRVPSHAAPQRCQSLPTDALVDKSGWVLM